MQHLDTIQVSPRSIMPGLLQRLMVAATRLWACQVLQAPATPVLQACAPSSTVQYTPLTRSGAIKHTTPHVHQNKQSSATEFPQLCN
mmetsp:Transcript_32644/g.72108  ORF Transcript_32644/g.72108 Transcript_32644/m.72108 type:complete len:87 (-) Transcript_32644:1505-1765(-)